jgi:hypothetical protein
MNPMVPFLTGWLAATCVARGNDCMKVEEIIALRTDCFEVKFHSGLRVVVTTKVVYDPALANPGKANE